MKTVSAAFTTAQSRDGATVVRQVNYKRRYWQESTKTYIWEASWHALDESEIISVSPVNWELDTERQSEFLISNVTLVVRNKLNEWLQKNPSGIFGRDSTSPLYAYEAFWTKFQIKTGFVLADGSTETVAIFTGLATDYNVNSEQGTMQLALEGLETLLVNANAENVSTTVTDETLGTGNGTNKVFTTAQPGVGIILYVSSAGIKNRASDYSISNLNVSTLGATITFNLAPLAGQVVRATYKYWYQGQTASALVKLLLTEAGVPTASQIVDNVALAATSIQTLTLTSKADFDAGTSTRLLSTLSIGDLMVNWADTSFKTLVSDFTSGILPYSQFYGSVTNVSGAMRITSTQIDLRPGVNEVDTHYGIATYAGTRPAAGVWQIDFTATGGVNAGMEWVFIAQTITVGTMRNVIGGGVRFIDTGMKVFSGYSISIGADGGAAGAGSIQINKYDASGIVSVLATASGLTTSTGTHTVRIERFPSGRIAAYWDGTLKVSASDVDYKSCLATAISGGVQQIDVDNIYEPPPTVTAEWISAEQNLGAIQSWSILNATLTGGGTWTWATNASITSGTGYDGEVLAAVGYPVASLVRQYLKIHAFVTVDTLGVNDPILSDVSVSYVVGIIFTINTLADYTDLTVYDAIQQYASFADMEFGFDPDETFFFRNRSTSKTPLTTISDASNAIAILSTSNGYERVYSEVEVSYGNYDIFVSADQSQYQSPRLRFLFQRLSIDGSNVLVPSNDDVATGMAITLFSRYSKPRRLFKLQTVIFPQLDLADIVTFSFQRRDLANPQWYLGDTSRQMGDESLQLYGDSQQYAWNLICKVIGVRFDTQNWTCEVDLEEVLL